MSTSSTDRVPGAKHPRAHRNYTDGDGYGGGAHSQDPSATGHYSGMKPISLSHVEDYPIVDGVIDDPGCNVRRNQRQFDDADEFKIELMTGNVFFRGGGVRPEQRPDTTVHVRYRGTS